jgi:multidrug efflux system outer membrane protein
MDERTSLSASDEHRLGAFGERSRGVLRLAIAALLVSGCNVGPDYKRPDVEAPEVFRDGEQPSEDQASLADLPWWEVFQDPTLHELVRTALENNYDARIAVARIEQARAIAGQAHAQYWPQVNYGGAVGGGKNEFAGGPSPNGGQTQASALVGVNATWEIDLWGRISRLNEAAQAQVLASEENRRGVMLSLVSEVATAYFELLELDMQLEIAKRTTDSFTESFRLFSRRYSGGLGSKLDVARAEADLATVSSQIPELEREISIKENQIDALLGRNPTPVERSAKLVDQSLPPAVPSGVPSQLLERRPDVKVAEALVRSANANVGVAKADYFPKISLTGFLGSVSPDVNDFFKGSSAAWGLGASALGPIFHGGALDAQLELAKAQWEEAWLQYRKVVLVAFQEVSNALVTRTRLVAIREQQERAVRANSDAVTLALQRYNAGKASYFEVLQAQDLLFPAENALAFTILNERLTVVALYQALGGGWNLSDAQWRGEDAAGEGGEAQGEKAAAAQVQR